MKILYLNGRFAGEGASGISVLSRGLQYGEGLFETIRVKDKKAEYLSLHLSRLRKGARLLGISIPRLKFIEIIARLIRENSLAGAGKLKILAFTGRTRSSSNICITIERYKPPPQIYYRDGVALSVGKHPVCSPLTCAKSISYLPYLLLREDALSSGCFDALLTGERGELLECSAANLFLYRDGCFYIPGQAGRLSGVMERVVIDTLKAQGLEVKSSKITRNGLKRTDIIFITNSLIGVLPIGCIGTLTFKGKIPEIIRGLISKFCPLPHCENVV